MVEEGEGINLPVNIYRESIPSNGANSRSSKGDIFFPTYRKVVG